MLNIKIDSKGKVLQVESIWLRDHCMCKKCFNPKISRRIFNWLDIPKNLKAIDMKYSKDGRNVEITWNDDHVSEYSIDFITFSQFEKFQEKLSKDDELITLWNLPKIKANLKSLHYNLGNLCTSDAVVKDLITSLIRYGLVFIENVPANVTMTEMTLRRLFPIMKTFYGEMFSFSNVYIHDDITYSQDYIGPHTDHTYFCDAGALQIFQCSEHDGTGGESFYIDGYHVAEMLRRRNPKAFEILSTVHVPAEFFDKDEGHRFSAPIIRVDPLTQKVYQIRLNLYDRSVFDTLPQTMMRDFYESLREFLEIAHDRENWFELKLNPGTAVIFDNWRLLHGRQAYTGKRVMIGAFVQRTDFLSKARNMGVID